MFLCNVFTVPDDDDVSIEKLKKKVNGLCWRLKYVVARGELNLPFFDNK